MLASWEFLFLVLFLVFRFSVLGTWLPGLAGFFWMMLLGFPSVIAHNWPWKTEDCRDRHATWDENWEVNWHYSYVCCLAARLPGCLTGWLVDPSFWREMIWKVMYGGRKVLGLRFSLVLCLEGATQLLLCSLKLSNLLIKKDTNSRLPYEYCTVCTISL